MTTYNQQLRAITGSLSHVAVTTATGTTVTYTTQSNHYYSVGDEVFIQGLSVAGHNGFFTITAVPSSTTFRVANTTTGLCDSGMAIEGNQYDDTFIDTLRINGGRMDITSPVSPMTCTVDILVKSDETTSSDWFDLNHGLVVQTYDDYTSKWVNLFVGMLTDIHATVDSWQNVEGYLRYSLSAATAMARLDYHSSFYSGSAAVVTSGNAAYLWIVEALNLNPDFAAGMYWYGTIASDSPVMHKRSNGRYFDSDIIQTAAASARGNFHDRPDGKVYYTSFANSATPSFYGYFENHISAYGLSQTKSITDVYNICKVSSTNTAITTAQSSNSTSIAKYGRREGTRSTELANQSAIDTQAVDFLAVRDTSRWRLGTITIDLANTHLDDEDRSTLYGTRTNSFYTFTLPTQFGGAVDTVVDNWSWSFSRGMAQIQLSTSLFTDLHP